MSRYKHTLTILCVLTTLASCTLNQKKPDEYHLIHETILRSDMRTMAASLGVLAELYFNASVTEADRLEIVQTELDKIKRIATNIRGADVITNYSVINRYMGAFLYAVDLAKQFADRDPPNYVPANRLLNSCKSCHLSFEY